MARVNGWMVSSIVFLTIVLACGGFAIWFWGVEGGVMPTLTPTNETTVPPDTTPLPTVTTTTEATTITTTEVTTTTEEVTTTEAPTTTMV